MAAFYGLTLDGWHAFTTAGVRLKRKFSFSNFCPGRGLTSQSNGRERYHSTTATPQLDYVNTRVFCSRSRMKGVMESLRYHNYAQEISIYRAYSSSFTTIDEKTFYTFFYYFYKKRVFKRFLFLERFLFSSGEIFYPTKPAKIPLNLLNFSIKRLLSDGFNMAAIKFYH